ncbi:MAG: L,D-transpeptidase [Fibrobacter sp.]|nr:L,D-transpeptidase [Fibrobacter sp.]
MIHKISTISSIIQNELNYIPNQILTVDSHAQTMSQWKKSALIKKYKISTSRYGIGNKENSFCTPPGIHFIVQKIGDDAPPGRIFRSRIDTGVNWHPGMNEENLILTRILRLKGLQTGINSGPGIDSFERYIYIHGTNHEDLIGTPMSHGCICMKNDDIIELFDSVKEGTVVYID